MHTLLHNIFCHKLCLFLQSISFHKTWYISCHIDIHIHFSRLLQNLISIVHVFPCSNVWLGAKDLLCLWHVHKAQAENVVKKIASAKDGKKYYLLWGRSCIHELVHWIMILFYGHNYK